MPAEDRALGCGTRKPYSERRGLAVVSALYQIRSAVAHDGVAPDRVNVRGAGKTETALIVEEAQGIVGDVLKRVVLGGSIPDWYSFELGGPDPPSSR
jgi:hypothetical protein